MAPANRLPGRDAEAAPDLSREPPPENPISRPAVKSTSRVDDGADSGRACEAPGCGRVLPSGRRRFCCDLCRVRGQRAERRTETGEFGQAVVRMIRVMARRVGASDIAAFGALWEVRAVVDRACATAIDQLRDEGFSWDALAAETGVSRQALSQWRKRRPVQPGVNGSLREDAP